MFGFVHVLNLVLLPFFWYLSDVSFRTKIVLILVYLLSWLLVFWSDGAFRVGQILLSGLFAYLTFGAEYHGRRR